MDIGEKVFGDWLIEEQLGSGAFGTVYKIKKEEFGESYYAALKVIHIPSDTNEIGTLRSEGMDDLSITSYYREIAQNLVNEIKILNSLKGHSNIVSYEDHKIINEDGDCKYTIYIRMELLTPFKDYIINHEIDEQQVAQIGMDLSNALILCEKNKIIHRDIKPDNVFVSKNGDFKLGDFGVARTVEKTMSQMSKKGTYSYMAPEVYLNKAYDKRADIYSLGLILYQLLNHNRTPFLPPAPTPIKFSDREQATLKRVSGEPIPPLNIQNKELAKVVEKACSADPNMRQNNAQELYDQLKKSIIKEDKTMEDFEKTVSPFGTPTPAAGNTTGAATGSESVPPQPQPEINAQDEFERTVSPFGNPVTPGAQPNVQQPPVQPGVQAVMPAQKPKNSIIESYKLFFMNYANFNGRCRRADYWNVVIVNLIINVIFTILAGFIGTIAGYILGLYGLAVLVPTLAIGTRRLHDIGKSGLYLLFALIPLAGPIILIVWFATEGELQDNAYGTNPKQQ